LRRASLDAPSGASGAKFAASLDMVDIKSWDRFVHTTPGRRFFERYRRKQQAKGSAWKRCAFVIAGILICLAGIFFLAVPGLLILAIGLALVAQESAVLARLLDRAEIRLRKLLKRVSCKVRGWRTPPASPASGRQQTPRR
jgi:hypothetical protein